MKLTVLVLIALAACGDPRAASNPAVPAGARTVRTPAYMKGALFVDADSALRFVSCGTTTERALTAAPDSRLTEAVTAVNGALRDSLFIEMLADTAQAAIVARETLFATSLGEGTRCDRPRELFAWIATGVEPFWRVTYDSAQLVLERPEPPREVVFDAQAPEVRGALTTVIGARALGKVHELKLGLLRESCRDGMSDAWYPFRAEVRVGDLALAGCARR